MMRAIDTIRTRARSTTPLLHLLFVRGAASGAALAHAHPHLLSASSLPSARSPSLPLLFCRSLHFSHGRNNAIQRPGTTAARLAGILKQLDSPQRRANATANNPAAVCSHELELLREAEDMWNFAKEKPLERLNSAVTGNMMKLHHLMGDIPRQMQIIQEALQLEAQQLESRPVFVDAANYSLLFNSLALIRDPQQYAVEARAAYDIMLQRRSSDQLRTDASAFSAYFSYLQRSDQAQELRCLWGELPPGLKEANPPLFVAMINALAAIGVYREADMLVQEMERLGMKASVAIAQANSHLGSDQMTQSGHDGSSAGTPPPMQPRDYDHLIQAAHACGRGSDARAWSKRASAAGVWHALDSSTRHIVATVPKWDVEHTPKPK